MVCRRLGGAIVCSRGPARRPPPRPANPSTTPLCRHAKCGRAPSQAGYACRTHWFTLSPDLRNRLWRADRDESAANGRRGPAWAIVAEEADRWLAEREARLVEPSRRQPELPL